MHPSEGLYCFSLGKPYAAVTAVHQGKKLIVQSGSVFIAKSDVQFAKLPKGYEIVSEDGTTIRPSGRFLISSETFDPFHALIDYQKETKHETEGE